MNAIDIKKIIDGKMPNIVKTIAFYYGEKYQKLIEKRMKNLQFYVYDDNAQIDKLESVDLVEIAQMFAKDITSELDLDDSMKKKVELVLGVIIKEAAKYDENKASLYIKNKLTLPKEFESLINKYVSKIMTVVNYYKNDYEVKNIYNQIEKAKNRKSILKNKLNELRKELLKKYFKIDVSGEDNVDLVWITLEAFESDNQSDSILEQEKINERKSIFYSLIGCKGDSYEELAKDFKKKKLVINDEIIRKCKEEYSSRFNEIYNDDFRNNTNIESIFDDLNSKGYLVDYDVVRSYLNGNSSILGVNFYCRKINNQDGSFIIYNNNHDLYSSDFNDTCIHEIIHYLGGNNLELNKKGLHYDDSIVYLHLEEAYTNYFSKLIAKAYSEKYGDIMEPLLTVEINFEYNCTLKYMEKVFELYGNELKEIQLSDNLSLDKAKKICPIDKIANSIWEILEADEGLKDKVSDEQIKKLVRGAKR
jgi:hypothetical protein